MAERLGGRHALLLRAHGQVLVAEGVPCLLADAVDFVENATALFQAMQIGEPAPLAADEIARFNQSFDRARHAEKLWQFYLLSAVDRGVIPEAWRRCLRSSLTSARW